MKHTLLYTLLAAACATSATAQPPAAASGRPDHVNNALSPYFPPVFSQDGGSCGSASRIGYMFTHEINAFRHANARLPENIYPTHFTWLLTNSHSGKEGMAMANGVPNSVVYGGTTYSRLFGNQDCSAPDFGWMQGYDKWYSAMFNRIERNSFCPVGVDTEKGREWVKNWLWNHCGDNDFAVGGIAGIGVASACKQASIPDDSAGINRRAGVVGQKYVTRWGDGVDHALTIVGYDDRLVFDLDSNGIAGEPDKDERGAWIIVNSWGSRWANGGFIYCPYKYGFPVRQHEGSAWKPEFYHVRKNYRPLRTLKVRMDYDHRSELKLTAGISADLSATEPDVSIDMEHFKFAGDGRSAKQKAGHEAATPMLGRWADGKLHTEPMEFGYDLTDLTAGFDRSRPLKYFFVIESLKTAEGSGTVHAASIIDYEFDRLGLETPMPVGRGVHIENHGRRTVVSVAVSGEPFFAPLEAYASPDGSISWQAPQPSHYALKSYRIYRGDSLVADVPAATRTYRATQAAAPYAVAAVYTWADTLITSARVPAFVLPAGRAPYLNTALHLRQGSFSLPNVLPAALPHATLEYWLRPDTLSDWNQSVGRGWGQFLIHTSADGSITAGWDGDARFDSRPGVLRVGQWTHLAFAIANDTLRVFANGELLGQIVSPNHTGFGGFGRLRFGTSREGGMSGDVAEVRLWKVTRTPDEISRNRFYSFSSAGLPETLLFCGRGERLTDSLVWADAVTRRPLRPRGRQVGWSTSGPGLTPSTDKQLAFELPATPIYADEAFTLTARPGTGVEQYHWQIRPASSELDKKSSKKGATNSELRPALWESPAMGSARFLLSEPGQYTACLIAGADTARRALTVLPRKIDAAFRPSTDTILAGERVTFLPVQPVAGGRYEWRLPKADGRTTAATTLAAATYEEAGNYRVSLRVTDPVTGRTRRSRLKFRVEDVAPRASFDVSPRIVQRGQTVTLTDRSRFSPRSWQWTAESRRYALRSEGRHAQWRMDVPGVYDVTLTATNRKGSNTTSERRAIIVCNADSRNGLNFSRPEAAVATASSPLPDSTQRMTLEWWMHAQAGKASAALGGDRASWTLQSGPNGDLSLIVDSATVARARGLVLSDGWHHYAMRYRGSMVTFYRDGEPQTNVALRSSKPLPPLKSFTMGGKERPMNAVVDEVRLWGAALPDTVLQRYANAPIADVARAERDYDLRLYYDFNQNGGDVKDRSSHHMDGRRTDFGPDGDAWGLSSGVFCLNFDTPLTDLTDSLLPPARMPFATTGNSVNRRDSKRFLEFKAGQTPAGWWVENAVGPDTLRTGAHVDRAKGSALTVTTRWDGFAADLDNHKVYATVNLPAGRYEFEVRHEAGDNCGASYIMAAEGKGLPNTADADRALASAPLSGGRLTFELKRPTSLSLGVVFSLHGQMCVPIRGFALRQLAPVEEQ